MNARISWAALAAALSVCACSSDSKTTAVPDGGEDPIRMGTGGKSSSGTDAGTKGETSAPTDGFDLVWNVSDGAGLLTDAGVPGPLAGVKVCVHEHPEIICKTTDDQGAFTLNGLPPLTDLILTLDKEGYTPESKTIQTASTHMSVAGAGIILLPMGVALPDGVTQDPKNGSADFLALGPSATEANGIEILSGVTVTISPSAGKGPYNYDTHGMPAKDNTVTGKGLGFYFDLPPGDYEAAFSAKGYDCVGVAMPLAAWGIPVNPNKVRFTVLPGYLTDELITLCTEASVIIGPDE